VAPLPKTKKPVPAAPAAAAAVADDVEDDANDDDSGAAAAAGSAGPADAEDERSRALRMMEEDSEPVEGGGLDAAGVRRLFHGLEKKASRVGPTHPPTHPPATRAPRHKVATFTRPPSERLILLLIPSRTCTAAHVLFGTLHTNYISTLAFWLTCT
jgi:hypothetical protein